MKRTCILILPLALGALVACGESETSPSAYFNALGDSLLSASKGTYFRVYSNNIELNAGIKQMEDGKEKKGSLQFTPLAFDLRVDHALDPSIGKTKVSFRGYNDKTKTTMKLTGDFKITDTLSFDIKPRFYLDNGTFYSDLADAGTLRLGINMMLKDYLTASFPIKGKLTSGLPSGLGFDIPDFDKEIFVKLITDCYNIATRTFSFSEADGIKTISFSSTDTEQLAIILEALLPSGKEEMISAITSMSRNYSLSSFAFAVSFTAIGPTAFTFDAGIRFPDISFASIQPDGEWKASGKMNFAYGDAAKAYTVDDPDSYGDIPIDWDKIRNLISVAI